MELSNEQKYALEKFKQGHNLFITGQGGTVMILLLVLLLCRYTS